VVPAAPSSLAATVPAAKQILISWQDNAGNEDGFRIERSTTGLIFTQVASVGRDVKTFRDTGLVKKVRYYYRVRAFNAAGNSDYSNVASATP
jgi:hypothetical protein